VVALLVESPRFDFPAPHPRPALAHHFSGPCGAARRPAPAVLRRRRILATVLLMMSVAAAAVGLQAALGRIGGSPLATTGAPGRLESTASRIWIVRPGDTLWSIAEALDPRGDVRPLVDRLTAETRGRVLYPGEPIALPGG
jgi:hypothetical protein